MSEATPRPWKLKTEQDQDFITRTVVGPNLGAGTEVAIITTGSYEDRMESANAKLIVRAVNNHDALLEACKEMRGAAAAMMRVIDSLAAVEMLEAELKAAAIEPGFGVRVQAAIAAAEANA